MLLLALLAFHLVLTALPGVAAALLAARLGVRRVPVLLAIGLAATGALAMLGFWLYYGDRVLGQAFSYLVPLAAAGAACWALRGQRIDRGLLRELSVPLALWALGSLFLVFLGFLHGGGDAATAMAANRFYGPLPTDNEIPRFFGEWFYVHGHTGHPFYPPDWLASDRPPLQVGYVLMQRPFPTGDSVLNYQVLGVVLQQLWIVGLWALLLAARVGKLTRGLVMLAILVSDVAIVNGFYVWPKLLPTAMLLAAAALVLTPLWGELRRGALGGLLVATLLSLAMLGHGSSVFGIVPLAAIALFRGLPDRRWLGAALLAALVLLAPWSAYQKYGEPPGNRLLKYMLAGVVEVDSRGTGEAFLDSYGEAGLGGTLHHKAENFVTMAGGAPAVEHLEDAADALSSGDLSAAVGDTRVDLFYNLLPSLGLFLVTPFAMLLARRRGRQSAEEWRLALACYAVIGIGALFWGLVMFGNEASRTVLHQGSFLLPVLGLCAGVCGLRATFPRFAAWLVGVNVVLMLLIYVPALDPLPGTGYSALAAVLAIAGLAGFAAISLPRRLRPAA